MLVPLLLGGVSSVRASEWMTGWVLYPVAIEHRIILTLLTIRREGLHVQSFLINYPPRLRPKSGRIHPSKGGESTI